MTDIPFQTEAHLADCGMLLLTDYAGGTAIVRASAVAAVVPHYEADCPRGAEISIGAAQIWVRESVDVVATRMAERMRAPAGEHEMRDPC